MISRISPAAYRPSRFLPSRSVWTTAAWLVGVLTIAAGAASADSVTFLPDDAGAARARWQLIEGARQSLEVSYFSIGDDAVSRRFVQSLAAASRRGVRVRLVIDSMHNNIPPSLQLALLHAGVQVREYHVRRSGDRMPQFRRMHDKALVSDGREMILGSRNIDSGHFGLHRCESDNFRDVDIRVAGAIVADVCRYFQCLWTSSEVKPVDPCRLRKQIGNGDRPSPTTSGNDHHGLPLEAVAASTGQAIEIPTESLRFVYDPAGRIPRDSSGTRGALYNLVAGARHSIVLETPYFLPTGEFGRVLQSALKRNVRVIVLTNSLSSTNHPLAYGGYLNVIRRYRGLEIWEYDGPRILHSKAMVVDGETVAMTSFNFDPRSAYQDTQVGLVMRDRQAAERLLAIMETHFARARYVAGRSRRSYWIPIPPYSVDHPVFGRPGTHRPSKRRHDRAPMPRLIAPLVRRQL
ncbi:MAG: phosphatidylserine/phosphatidylglycerophosphate/cardiolipin synthase family protein [Planctomycetes bacterium]|nr:phosphatidylserine/phosphatidylglycerophosphate/cardiolipin synthase family protein [Planctomycetota bacterium]